MNASHTAAESAQLFFMMGLILAETRGAKIRRRSRAQARRTRPLLRRRLPGGVRSGPPDGDGPPDEVPPLAPAGLDGREDLARRGRHSGRLARLRREPRRV